MKYFKKLIPLFLVVLYVYVSWPRAEKEINQSSDGEGVKTDQSLTESAKPVRPERKREVAPPVVGTPKVKKFIRPESDHKKNPATIKYARSQQESLEKGPGEIPAISEEKVAISFQFQSIVEVTEKPLHFSKRLRSLVSGKAEGINLTKKNLQ